MTLPISSTFLFHAHFHDAAYDAALAFLQVNLCAQKHDAKNITSFPCAAPDCRKLKQEQHHAAFWIKPSKQQYVLEDLELIFELTHFARDKSSPCFFVIEQAHMLPPVCANKLLKILEEPTEGYYFLLVTSQPDKILPTIKSRCVITAIASEVNAPVHSLLSYFYPVPKRNDPFEFEQLLKKSALNNTQSTELVHDLYTLYLQEKMNATRTQKPVSPERLTFIESVVPFLQKALLTPPQQGAGDLFWKNLYLLFPRLL